MPVVPAIYVDPPEVKPYRWGLFGSTSELVPDDEHWMIGGVEFDSLAGYHSSLYPMGYAMSGGAGGTKAWSAFLPTLKAFPFTVYAGVQTGSIGRTPAYHEARARAILELGAQNSVEQALWTGGGGETPNLNLATGSGGATDVTGGVATELTTALGLLEDWLGTNYNGVGLIHAKRLMGAHAATKRLVKIDPGNPEALITPLGNRWVFGGGYDGTGPGAAAPGAGNTWIYATPAVFIARSEIVAPATFQEALNRSTNQQYVIAEQSYLVGIDGPWAAAKIGVAL